mmetsp:Transcript_111602/g.320609  ORF Transcript_111602/g.320609 Transcript_111602/m.320609 type:complete len:311 (-) Transcript_111602:35-967(-)
MLRCVLGLATFGILCGAIPASADVHVPRPCDVPLAHLVLIAVCALVAVESGDFGLGHGVRPFLPAFVVPREAGGEQRAGKRRYAQAERESVVEVAHALHQRLCMLCHLLRDLERKPTIDDEVVGRDVRRTQPSLRLHHLGEHGLDDRLSHFVSVEVSKQGDPDDLYTSQGTVPIFKHPIRRAGDEGAPEGEHKLLLRPHPPDLQAVHAIRHGELLGERVAWVPVQAVDQATSHRRGGNTLAEPTMCSQTALRLHGSRHRSRMARLRRRQSHTSLRGQSRRYRRQRYRRRLCRPRTRRCKRKCSCIYSSSR